MICKLLWASVVLLVFVMMTLLICQCAQFILNGGMNP